MIQGISAISRDPGLVVEGSLELSAVTFSYVDRISEQVVAAYQSERDRWMRNRGTVRLARVNALLAGGAVDLDDTETALGYALRQSHRGVVGWVDDSIPQADRLARLERLIRRLADQFHSEHTPLVVAPDESTIWAWLPATAGPADLTPVPGWRSANRRRA
jgi:hypothetical protein